MTSDQANQMLQTMQTMQQYQQDTLTGVQQSISFLAALHQGLLIGVCFLIVFGLIRAVQSRPRAGD